MRYVRHYFINKTYKAHNANGVHSHRTQDAVRNNQSIHIHHVNEFKN